MKRAISGTLLAVGVLAVAGSLAAFSLSATPIAHAQTAPPAPTLGTLVATSACAIAVPWTEPSGGTPAATFTLQRDALQMTNLKNLGGQVYSESGAKEYLDTRAWNLVNMGVGTTEATLNTDPGVSHQYRVQACSSAGNCSAWTPTVAKAAKLLPQPSNIGVPTNVSAIGSSTDSRIVRVRFSTSTSMSVSFKGFGGFVIASSGPSIFVPASWIRSNGTFVYEEQGNPAATTPTTYHLSFYESDRYCLPPPTRSTQYTTSLLTDVVVPPRPTSFTATFQAAAPPVPNRIRLVWTNIPSATDGYYITRTTTDVSGNRVTYTLPHDQLLAGTTSFTDDFNIVASPPRTYTYQIRACSTSGGCSFEQTKSEHSSNSVVWDLEAWPIYASTTNSVASIRIQWKTETEGGIPSVTVKLVQGGTTVRRLPVNGQTSATLNDIPWSATPYQVLVGQDATGYEQVQVDLNITKVFSGTIFSSMGDDTILPPFLGVGWISLNSDTPCPVRTQCSQTGTHYDTQTVLPGVRWAVFARADGSVGGEGFAAVQPDDLGWHGYGWVSFQKDDLRGCPSVNPADCRATYDAPSGAFHGWARVCDSPDDVGEVLTGCRASFATPTMAATYSKWISLDQKEVGEAREMGYGTPFRFNAALNALEGHVWGGDVLGWGEASGGMSTGCTAPAPTVTSTVQATSVTLDWTVPSNAIYDNLRIIRINPDNLESQIYDAADVSGGHLVDSGLTPDTNYTYRFVRRQGTNSCMTELQVRTLTGGGVCLALAPAITHTSFARSIKLNWTIPAGTTYSRLRITRNGTEIFDLAEGVPGSGSKLDEGLTPDTNYTYRFEYWQGTNSCSTNYPARTLTGNPTPTLDVSPTSLSFSATVGGTPPTQTITVSNTGGGTMNWIASDDQSWLSLTPTSGTNNGTVSVSVVSKPAGIYIGTTTVSTTGITPVQTRTVGVTFTVSPGGGGCSNPQNAYLFSCTPGTLQINTVWTGNFAAPHIAQLLARTHGTAEAAEVKNTVASTPSQGCQTAEGQWTHAPLPSGASYDYRLRVRFNDGSPEKLFPVSGSSTCTVGTTVGLGAITDLNVYTRNQSTLNINWTDNIAEPHNIILERIKVTPSSSTIVSVTDEGWSVARITWQNNSNRLSPLTTPFPTPFYHVLEWSTFPTPFSTNDPTVRFSTVEFPGDRQFRGSGLESYTTTTGSLASGNYTFRLKACSYILVDLVNHLPGNTITPATRVCSGYSATTPLLYGYAEPRSGDEVALTPGSAFFGNLFDHTVLRAFRALDRFGTFLGTQGARAVIAISRAIDRTFAQVGPPGISSELNPFFLNSSTTLPGIEGIGSYVDTGLAADTVYAYRVKAKYTDGTNRETDYSNIAAGKTQANIVGPTCPRPHTYPVQFCTRNSFCETVQVPGDECVGSPPNACSTNADCRYVGTSLKSVEETKP